MACVATWLGRHVECMAPGRSGCGDVEAAELNKVGGGFNGSLMVLRGCLEEGYVEEAGGEGDGEVNFKRKLLESVIRQLLPQPNFPTLLCEAVRQIRGLSDQFLRDLCQALELGLPERLLLGLALGCAEDKSRRRESQRFCAQALADLLQASGAELSEELLHQLSCHLHRIGRAGRVSLASLGSVPGVQRKAEQSLLLAPLGVGEGSEVNCLRTFEQVAGDSYHGHDDLMEELAGAMDVAHLAEELGYECAADRQRCSELFSVFPAVTEAEVAKVVGMVARTHTGLDPAAGAYGPFAQAFCSTTALPAAENQSLTAWDVDVLRDTLQGCHPNLDWVAVMEQLDHEGFVVPDQKAFDALLSFFKEVSQDNFPIYRVVGRVWKNHDSQLSFLKFALAGSPDGIPFPLTPDKPSDERGWRDPKSPYDAQQWNSYDMSAVLCKLAEMGHAGSLRPVLKNLVNWNPGLLTMKVANIKTEWNVVRTDLLTMLVPQLILGENNRDSLRQLWHANSDIVTRTLISVHARDPNTVLKSIEQCLKLDELQYVLDAAPFSFSIDVAVMHWKESLADLERWLEKHLSFQKDVMLRACVRFLQSKAAESESGRSPTISGPLPLSVQAVFYKVVLEGSGIEAFKGALRSLNEQPDVILRMLCLQFGRFQDLQEKERLAVACAFGSLVQLSPNSTETGVRYIHGGLGHPMHSKLFSFGLVALEQCKDRLILYPGFSKSILQLSHPREAYGELAPLLEEGAAIAAVVVPPLNSNVTGLPGLELVKSVPSVTLASDALVVPKQVKQIPPLSHQQLPPLSQPAGQLSSERLDDLSQQETRGSPQGRQLGWGMASNGVSAQSVVEADQTSDSMGHALPINTLLAARSKSSVPTPDSEVRSKLTFIVNNISTGNLELKAKEFKAVLQDQYLLWFAQYLVVERASIEPNFHDLYLKFLEAISAKSLLNEVIQATYENCKVLLNSPLLRTSAGERSLLKHLGAWLGKLTIERNIVLRARDLDPKGLLIEAYEKGLMFAVLPFTCKILEACQNSHVYRPPNPWTTAILGLLAEIYVLENLQKNLQFEIEILFKNINVELQTVRPSELLVGRTHLVEGNVDFRWRSTGVSQQVAVKEEKSALVQVEPPPDVSSSGVTMGKSWISVPHVAPTLAPSYEESGSGHGMRRSGQLGVDLGVSYQPPSSIVPSSMSVPPSVIMNQRLLSCGEKFRVLVQKGMEKAIQETLQYILEHYLALACKTTTVLVAKDYAGEDPSAAQEAAYIMAAGLSSRLAGLCKDLFRNAMYNNIALMLSKGLNIQGDILGQAVELVTTDNLSLGFGAVEDATIRFALARMKKHAETEAARRQAGSPFEASGFEGSKFSRQSHDVQQPSTVRSSNSWQQAYEGYALLLPQKNVMAAKVATAPGPFPESGGYSFPAEPIASVGLHIPELPDEELDPSARLPMGFVSNALFDEAIQLQDKKASHNEDGASLLDLTREQASLRDQAARFFQKWMVICETAVPSDKVCMDYMSQLQRSGFLDRDDTFDLFFQNLLELAVTHSLNSDAPPVSLFQSEEGLSFAAIDTFAKLVVLLVKRDAGEPKMAGVNLLKKILRVTVHVIQKNGDEKTHNFHPRLYFRLFVTWLIDFSVTEWDTAKLPILNTFGTAFLALQPSRLPCWTFAWWELVSHRKFMPRLLLSSAESGWPLFHRLLVAHLRFMEPYLRVAVLADSMRTLYKGTLRVLLVLVHDFPEFLCAYYFSLCAEIPPTCIQMRNLILSAFPRSITLPDPLSANLKVDMLPDMKVAPRILSDVGLGDDDLKSEVDQYLRTWHPESLSTLNLKQRLMLSEDEVRKAGTQYNVPLLRALVLHVGIEAIKILQSPTQDSQAKQIGRNAPMAIFHSLMVELDREGRHLFCSALADQLRYPNSHTHYFSCVLLYLFAKFKDETWREQIARVLIERYVARRPHPWGLQVTVIELARNSGLGLWETSFMADPHIRGLFASFLPVSGK